MTILNFKTMKTIEILKEFKKLSEIDKLRLAIHELIKTFNITRSLSNKGNPYDNAVAEATYKIIKTEFAFNRIFSSFEELETDLFDYVNWYNNIRIHGSLDYLTPIGYRQKFNINLE